MKLLVAELTLVLLVAATNGKSVRDKREATGYAYPEPGSDLTYHHSNFFAPDQSEIKEVEASGFTYHGSGVVDDDNHHSRTSPAGYLFEGARKFPYYGYQLDYGDQHQTLSYPLVSRGSHIHYPHFGSDLIGVHVAFPAVSAGGKFPLRATPFGQSYYGVERYGARSPDTELSYSGFVVEGTGPVHAGRAHYPRYGTYEGLHSSYPGSSIIGFEHVGNNRLGDKYSIGTDGGGHVAGEAIGHSKKIYKRSTDGIDGNLNTFASTIIEDSNFGYIKSGYRGSEEGSSGAGWNKVSGELRKYGGWTGGAYTGYGGGKEFGGEHLAAGSWGDYGRGRGFGGAHADEAMELGTGYYVGEGLRGYGGHKIEEVKVPVKHTTTIDRPYPVDQPRPVDRPYPVEVKTPVDRPYPYEVQKPYPEPVRYPVRVEVPVREPYPVVVAKPVDHPYPVIVQKQVPVAEPYPFKVRVPVEQSYSVEVKVPVLEPYPVTFEVPVDKPYPVYIEKEIPVPEPYPVEIRVPVPVYVPKPYPVQVKVPVDEPYPVEVRVPVPDPYPVTVEKDVPVPEPYPVEKRIPVDEPYPVEVDVPVDHPYAVPVPKPYPVHETITVPEPYPVPRPFPYPVERTVAVPKDRPYPVPVPRPYPVPVKVGHGRF